MSSYCSCAAESLLCSCAANIVMANLELVNDKQSPLQNNASNSPLEIPARPSSPNQSPKSSPRPSHKKEFSRSEKSVGREISPSQLYKLDSDTQASISRSSESITVPTPELVRSTSQISHTSGEGKDGKDGKERKESRSSDRIKKKSAWYHALTPSYKSRSEEFKRYFKDLPADERLIVDYSCAVQKDLLIQGRLYVTQNYLCFYAIYFRWETCISIRWKEVTSVTKEKTALIIPNAIMISTDAEKLFFATFNARDKAYLTLFRVWQNALMDKPLSIKETWSWVHEAYGDELGLSSDDEYFEQTASGVEDKPNNIRLSPDSLSEDPRPMASNIEDPGSSAADSSQTNKSSSSPHQPIMGAPDKSPKSELAEPQPDTDPIAPTDYSDTTESDAERNLITEPVRCPCLHEGRLMVSLVLPLHVDQLFTLLFTNSKFFLEFHALRRTTDIKVTSWQPNPDTGEKVRTVTMVVAISQTLGPKSSNVQETQVMKACSKPGQIYVIDGDVVNSGIPYADSFYVDTHYCLVRTGDQETTLSIYSHLKYKKTVWQLVKSLIEKNTWAGLDDFYESLVKSLQGECGETTSRGRHSRRQNRNSSKAVLLPVEEIAAAQSRIGSIHKKEGNGENRSDFLIRIVFAVLIFLLLLNTLLYYKLWFLESWATASRTNLTPLDLEVLRNPPKTHEEWLELFRQQESLHRAELARWQAVLQAAVKLLKRAEEALSGLQVVAAPPDEL